MSYSVFAKERDLSAVYKLEFIAFFIILFSIRAEICFFSTAIFH
jgi:hypothetical protein